MIVGVDGRAFARADGRGIANYAHGLLGALSATRPHDEFRVLIAARDAPRLPVGLRRANVVPIRRPVPPRAYHGAVAAVRRPRLDRALGHGLDVLWLPSPAPVALSATAPPVVLTLYDLSWEERPADFTRYERVWHRLARPRAIAAAAARVATISQVTARAAIERWRLDPARVVAVPTGVRPAPAAPDAAAVAAARARHGLGERYVLFVGALEPRKAPDVLVRAHARARAGGLDAELAIVGAGRLAAGLGGVGGHGVHLVGRCSDSELDLLYAGALAVALPSRLEGFGLPPLEALARGVPVVVTDLPVFRETLGDAALRVPVDDEAALARALVRLGEDAALRSRLLHAAGPVLARHTWEATARAMAAVFAAAAGEPR